MSGWRPEKREGALGWGRERERERGGSVFTVGTQ